MKDQGGDAFRLLQISNIGLGAFRETGNFRWITEETFQRLRCTEINVGDVLIARMPEPTGRAWYVTSLPWRAITAVDVAIVRPDRAELDGRFLAYQLNAPQTLALVESLTTGTTRRRIRRADIERLVINLPAISEQQRIASILGSLDTKIDHNRAVGARLLELARFEFEHWSRFLSDVPRVPVADLISAGKLVVNDGYRAKNSEMAAEGLPFLRGGNVGEDDVDLERAETLGHDGVARAGEKVSRTGDVFFTAKGTVGRVGRVSEWTPTFVYSPQIAFWRSLDRDLISPEYLYLWLGSSDFIAQRDAVKGQTDMADYVNLRDQRAMTIVVPPRDKQVELLSLVRPLLDSEALRRTESSRLIAIRNELLPMLVSGRIRVPESYGPGDVLRVPRETSPATA